MDDRDDHALRALFDQSHDAVFLLDLEGRHLKANRRAAELLGYSEEEIQHLSYREISAEPFQSERNLTRLLQGEHLPVYERTFRRKDGTLVPVEISAELVCDAEGNPQHVQSVVRDISARKRAEAEREAALEALRESEARTRAILSAIPDLMFVHSRDGTYLDYHAGDPDALYASPETFLGKRIATVLPDAIAAPILEAIQRVFETGRIQRCEYPLDIEGRSRHFEARIVPYGDNKALSIIREITEQRQAEEAYRALVEQSLQGLVVIQDDTVVYANPAVAKLSGYTIEELQALTPAQVRSVVHPDDRQRVWMNIGRLLAGEPAPERLRFRFIRKNSEVRWVACSASQIEYQGRPAVQAMYIDITERKEAEAQREAAFEALRESEERFKLAMEATQDGLWDWNVKTDEVYRSPAYARMLGYAPEALIPTLDSWLDLVHPEDRETVISANQACAENLHDSFEVEFRMRTKDGQWRWILGRAKAIAHDPEGRATRVIGTHTDITERKHAEAQREAAFEALQESRHWLEELSKRLVQTQELERRTLARELHEDIAHVMLAVKLNLQSVLSNHHTQGTDDAIRVSMDALDDAIQRMQHLSRELRPAVLDDLGLVPALRALVDRQAARAPYQATFAADRRDYRLPAILENAYFRIAQEAVTNVTRHAAAEHVTVELQDEGGVLALTIRDDGIGFDIERMLNGERAEECLGLISMRERARLIGGTVEIASQPGRGTEIRVRTPIAPAHQERSP